MLNGVINVYKETGYTSRDAVSRLAGILRQCKIGHTGTLDPDAEGVLPMCVGKATKLCELLTGGVKEYKAVMKLGFSTDTEDTSGSIVAETNFSDEWYTENITVEKVSEVLTSFLGDIEQIPPMYSAKKVDGKRLYELAREGKIIERKPSKIHIYRIDIDHLDIKKREISITVECSKGTYIRTLCKDIGEKLFCLASMAELLRTRTGDFFVKDSYKLDELEVLVRESRIHEALTPVEYIFKELYECRVKGHSSILLDNGAPLFFHNSDILCGKKSKPDHLEQFRMYNRDGIFRAVYSYDSENNKLKVYKMF